MSELLVILAALALVGWIRYRDMHPCQLCDREEILDRIACRADCRRWITWNKRRREWKK